MFEQEKLILEANVRSCNEEESKFIGGPKSYRVYTSGGSFKSNIEIQARGLCRFIVHPNVYNGKVYFRIVSMLKRKKITAEED